MNNAHLATYAIALIALVLTAEIAGFFYAWVCSTMWGLDQADPRVAVPAMQAMNASVRNAVFFPAFFLTPVLLAAAAYAAWSVGARSAALGFALAAMVYVFGAFLPTMLVNVPMNEALAQLSVGQDEDAARAAWQAYSPRWQVWNTARAVASFLAVLLVGASLMALPRAATAVSDVDRPTVAA